MRVDVIALTMDYLDSQLPAKLPDETWLVGISKGVPDPRPDRLVRVKNVGSLPRTLVHRDTRVVVECWSQFGDADAAALAEYVYETLDDWDLVPQFDGWASGPLDDPDPDTGTARYTMIVIVRHRI